MTPKQALKRLREMAKTDAALSKWAGCSRQAVSNWRQVPAERVLRLEKASGISRHYLRPDIYGAKPQ